MSFEERKPHWSVYDGLRIIAFTSESVMAETDRAISKLEFDRANALLHSFCASSLPNKSCEASSTHQDDDDHISDEACKAGLEAIAVDKLDEALDYLNKLIDDLPLANLQYQAQ